MSDDTLTSVATNWLLREAQLLDSGEERAWLATMVSEQIRYIIPVRETVGREADAKQLTETSLSRSRNAFHAIENYTTLSARVMHNEGGSAWSSRPTSLIRHFVTNVRAELPATNQVAVRSNLLLFRLDPPETVPNFHSCERRDTLIWEGDQLRLLRRIVLLDHQSVKGLNLWVIF